MWINRTASKSLLSLAKSRPALLVTGCRQVGKSSLLKKLFPNHEYITLDRVAQAQAAEENPESFLSAIDRPCIIDEIQHAPSLFRELKIRIDEDRQKNGQWILTGSQKFHLMKNVSESLAGRLGIYHLESLSVQEVSSNKQIKHQAADLIWKGGFPELWAGPDIEPRKFFDDYIQTYLERDLRIFLNVSNLREFRQFMVASAIRVGQLVNFSDIAKDVGVSAVTIKSWLSALEASGLISLMPPYFKNLGKRLIKAPKLYFADNGLLCNLLNIGSQKNYENHLHKGQIFENFIFTEIVKNSARAPDRSIFFYRDQNGVEVDFLLESENQIELIEVKAAERIDERKLNFAKVAPLFKKPVSCKVACTINETRPQSLRTYTLFNPILHPM